MPFNSFHYTPIYQRDLSPFENKFILFNGVMRRGSGGSEKITKQPLNESEIEY